MRIMGPSATATSISSGATALRRTVARWLVAVGALLAAAWGALPTEAAAPPIAGDVHLLDVDGVISPTSARYVARELDRAADARAGAVVLRLDTPGGLDVAMRDMSGAILGSEVPVVVWVAPPGARAASAGMFVTLASHLAAMAPGTSIGAAHPVALGGAPDDPTAEKATQDAAAFARSLAELRGRNGAWAERAVLESISASGDEAVRLGVVELLAEDLGDVLAAADGWTVDTRAGPTTLRTAAVGVVERPMSLVEGIVQAITDPTIAYLLLSLGTIGIIAELYHPGATVPGVVGAVSLVLAFVALGSLPVSWAGVALLLLGGGLFVADLAVAGLSALSVAGGAAFVLGSLLLYQPLSAPSPASPAVKVDPWAIAAVACTFLAFFLIVGRAVLRVRRRPIATGGEGLVGQHGVVIRTLDPSGTVTIDGEAWSARAEDPPVAVGSEVEVVDLHGVILRVKRL